MPSLFAWCIAHWFTSLNTLARYDEPGLNLGFENSYSPLLSGLASLLCATLMSPQRRKQYCPQIEYINKCHVTALVASCDCMLCQSSVAESTEVDSEVLNAPNSVIPSYGLRIRVTSIHVYDYGNL